MGRHKEILPKLHEAIANKSWREANAMLLDMLPADALSLILDLGTTERVIVFRLLPKQTAAEVFTDLPPDCQKVVRQDTDPS